MATKHCILLTGGAGYVGSHTAVELVNAGYDVVVMDNLVNAGMECIKKVKEITGKEIPAYKLDLLDKEGLRSMFKKHKFTCVIHFAGLKAVGVSCEKPMLYYNNNIVGTINLLEVMTEFSVFNLIFSSSATVYGSPRYLPYDEKHPTGGCTNPYGKTKYFLEEIFKDLCAAEKQWNIVLLRYFNPVGAHASGKIGEDPQGIPNNLVPFIAQVAVGRLKELVVFGNDFDTPDGSGVRDYIHVVDLAQGHLAALQKVDQGCGCKVYNLGTGKPTSVLEIVKTFEKASGKHIPYKIGGRRAGDLASFYADPSLAEKELGWKAKFGLDKMCEDTWSWQSNNPTGFKKGGD